MDTTTDSHCSCTSPSQCIDLNPGHYLVAICQLRRRRNGRVSTGAISDHLEVNPSSATEMIEKLADAELTDYEPYRGVTLTEDGERIARELDRRQHIVRTFFKSVLAVSLDTKIGYQFGYHLSESGIKRLHELILKNERHPSK